PLGEAPIIMGTDGPWGGAIRPFLPLQGVAFCREKLGLPPVQVAGRFDFGKPCLFLPRPAAFAISDTSLWVAIAGNLLLLDFNLQTNKQLRLPIEPATSITAICVGPSKIWVGTAGEGLVEYDKASDNFRHLTEKDGLFLDHVSTFCLQDQ